MHAIDCVEGLIAVFMILAMFLAVMGFIHNGDDELLVYALFAFGMAILLGMGAYSLQ